MTGQVEGLVKDPVIRVLLQHDERIRRLETLYQVGLVVASAGVTLLGGILTVLLMKGGG